jgi:hypothetical protein
MIAQTAAAAATAALIVISLCINGRVLPDASAAAAAAAASISLTVAYAATTMFATFSTCFAAL